jgi:hypothetical protein
MHIYYSTDTFMESLFCFWIDLNGNNFLKTVISLMYSYEKYSNCGIELSNVYLTVFAVDFSYKGQRKQTTQKYLQVTDKYSTVLYMLYLHRNILTSYNTGSVVLICT